MSCNTFTITNPACRSIQIIEPDNTLFTSVSFGGVDQSLDESGSTLIPAGPPARLFVTFATQKASNNYRFEYLYIETPGISNPGAVAPVVVDANVDGFLVDFAGVPLGEGYILQWRVIVVGQISTVTETTPESLRLQLPQARVFTATFVFPRSTNTYGFSELRVENLITSADLQRIILAQVVEKTTLGFTVGLNPPPNSENYYLVARVP